MLMHTRYKFFKNDILIKQKDLHVKWKQINIHSFTCLKQIPNCELLQYIRKPCTITGKLYKKEVSMIILIHIEIVFVRKLN